MKKNILLLFIVGLFLSCNEPVKKKSSLRIFPYSSIGQENDPIPNDLIELSIPFTFSEDTVILLVDSGIKTPMLFRVDNGKQFDMSVDLGQFGISDELDILQQSVRNNLKSKKIIRDFAKPFDSNFKLKSSVDSILKNINRKSDVAIIVSNSNDNRIYKGYRIFNNIDSVKSEISRNVRSNPNLNSISILYGIDSKLLFEIPISKIDTIKVDTIPPPIISKKIVKSPISSKPRINRRQGGYAQHFPNGNPKPIINPKPFDIENIKDSTFKIKKKDVKGNN